MRRRSFVSDGREVSIFRYDLVEDLPGRHGGVLAAQIEPNERVIRIVYCPIWSHVTRTPFGFRCPLSSHAVCLTDRRLLISYDFHNQTPPIIRAIDRESIIGIDYGRAFLLGWFVVRLTDGSQISDVGFLFGAADGREDLEDLLRAWRIGDPLLALSDDRPPPGGSQRPAAWHRTFLRPLWLADEACLVECDRDPVWASFGSGWRKRAVCLAGEASLIVTNRSIHLAARDPPHRPGERRFAGNVTCTPLKRIVSAKCEPAEPHDRSALRLRIDVAAGRVVSSWEILFPAEQRQSLEQLSEAIEQLMRNRCDVGETRLVDPVRPGAVADVEREQ